MKLRPSKIRYSQDSISNVFCDVRLIGETLDNLCDDSIDKYDIPTIEVAKVDGKWYTADNRRLWVFRKLEELGKCRRIPVDEIDEIPSFKMTTTNRGKDIVVRGRPGGIWIQDLESNTSSSSDDSSDDEFNDRFRDVRI